jgi:hypothetical protein
MEINLHRVLYYEVNGLEYSLLTSWTRISTEGTTAQGNLAYAKIHSQKPQYRQNTKDKIYQTHSYVL